MCEQTEINYLDGDVVWVKLGSSWWPGQVVGLQKLPDDVQVDFQKKPLIAAVKFFQEESFEFVKNYQQIYKYNCTQKEDFIRKGLDKYRAKSKDGSNYMDKFPEDVKTAETLTDGDPNILLSDKFNPEEKPDISGLFGEKKIPKKKRNRDDLIKKCDSNVRRRVTHLRFLRESDHEIRIRQQPKNLPSTSSSSSSGGVFPCQICGFTATRVNVIICHLKSHRLNNETAATIKLKAKATVQPKPKQKNSDSPKRKYARKSVSNKSKNDSNVESGKRKHSKQVEKPNKKKKSDPEWREQLLADWNVDSDEDEPSDIGKSVNVSSMELTNKHQSGVESADDTDLAKDESTKDNTNNTDLLQESDKLLQETDSFAKLSMLKDVSSHIEKIDTDENYFGKSDAILSPRRSRESFQFKKSSAEKSPKDKDDKNSRLSCFDFEEDDVPEPSISSVRKIPRGLGSKNMSIKKEIIKEFEMSQALKNDMEKDSKNDESCNTNLKKSVISTMLEKVQTTKDAEDSTIMKNEENKKNEQVDNQKLKKTVELCQTQVEIVKRNEKEKQVTKLNVGKADLEIDNVGTTESESDSVATVKLESDNVATAELERDNIATVQVQEHNAKKGVEEGMSMRELRGKAKSEMQEALEYDEKIECKLSEEIKQEEDNEIKLTISEEINNINLPNVDVTEPETRQISHISENQEIIFDKLTAEVKEKTSLSVDSVSEMQDNSDFEVSSNFKSTLLDLSKNDDNNIINEDNLNSSVKKRRGRPRKNLTSTEELTSDNEHIKSSDFYKKIEIVESDRKTSESDSDRSYSGRKRKPNRKYQSSLCLQSFEHGLSKTDESLSENDDKLEQAKSKTKSASSNIDVKLVNRVQNLNSPSNYANDRSSVEADAVENIVKNDSEIKELIKEQEDILDTNDASKQSSFNNLKKQKEIIETTEARQNKDVELLPAKKFQIKEFELSQIDSSENDIVQNLNVDLNTHLPKIIDETKSVDIIEPLNDKSVEIQNETLSKVPETTKVTQVLNDNMNEEVGQESFKDVSSEKTIEENALLISSIERLKSPSKIVHTEKSLSVVDTKVKKGKFDDNQFDSFQDAFIKTLQVENLSKAEDSIEAQKLGTKNFDSSGTKNVCVLEPNATQNFTEEPAITNYSIVDNFDSIEVVVTDNAEVEVKSDEVVPSTNDKNIIHASNDNTLNTQNSNLLVAARSPTVKFNENLKKLDESINSTVSLPSTPEVKVTVPVKKREKPRIIENVALKEPMILKTKLMEKHAGKIGKHKLESDNIKPNESKSFPKTKVMKMETVISNCKNRSQALSGSPNLVTKKIVKTFKAEDGSLISPLLTDVRNEVFAAAPKSEVPSIEKCIQQSSQSLVDMELDINSMPFVLSEDVLTPESIEQMPVVISSVIPAINPITTTLSTTLITPTKQITSANQSFDSSQEVSEVSPKKKSGTPTILKSKSKAKPTITSIKTVVPPLASAAFKGGYKVNTQALKTSLGNQKTPGKYVIVQTSGHQHAYSTHQKVAIPTNKGSGNAQIVQQGGKVVILTSPQSGQPGQKVLPLNSISKALNSGKVQRIITTKQGQQVFTSVSPQSLGGSKTALTSKSGEHSSSMSKMPGQKMLGHQQMITSKSVLTQMSGTITKSTVLGTLPQGIITKEGIFTPINASTIGGKTIISSKTLVAKGFPTQGISTSKNILSPITQSLSGKTIISSQGIVSKGTVLTPITGSQVKALAAKNIKGSKSQCQNVQRKVQLTGAQKSPKVPISSSPARSSSVVVLQNTEVKTLTPNKKAIKQPAQKQATVTTVLSPSTLMTMQQKVRVASTTIEQKIGSPKTINRTIKLPPKVVTEKTEESIHFKPLTNNEIWPLKTKVAEQQKPIGSVPVAKSTKGVNKNLQKRISNVANSAAVSPSNSSASLSITVPPLEPYGHENIPKKDEISEKIISKEQTVASTSQHVAVSETEKVEEPKVSMQAQIMALPMENSDGTPSVVFFTFDEQGHIIPLDNNALMSLDGTSNIDGSRTVYIDSSSLEETGNMDNIVFQIDNGSLSNLQPTTASEPTPAVVTETLASSEISQTTNRDILAAALANTDFQHEIGIAETSGPSTMTSLTQTSLINQTILQSTIIPPTEPISSPLVLETSLTLNQPIMTPLEVPSSLSIQSELIPISSTTMMSTSLKVPITTANQHISYIATEEPSKQIPGNSMPEIDETVEISSLEKTVDINISSSSQCTHETNLVESVINEAPGVESKSVTDVVYSISIPENDFDKKQIQTPSMPIIDDTFNANNGFDATNASVVLEDNLRNFVTKTSEELIQDLTGNDSLQENNETIFSESTVDDKECTSIQKVTSETGQVILSDTQDDCVSSQQCTAHRIEQSEEKVITESIELSREVCAVSSESSIEVQSSQEVEEYGATDEGMKATLIATESTLAEAEEVLRSNEELACEYESEAPSRVEVEVEVEEEEEEEVEVEERMKVVVDVARSEKTVEAIEEEASSVCQTLDSSAKGQPSQMLVEECKISLKDEMGETSQEAPSQSYKQLVSATSDVAEVPSQSAKSENCREATQSLAYEEKAMETEDNALVEEPPSQSYEDSKENEASQSYRSLRKMSVNAPTQSFSELMQIGEERAGLEVESNFDEPNFPTQSYEVEKMQEKSAESAESDAESSQEGNIPSQSNDIAAEGIGTSSASTNNSALNEDETASSSYVPETPETQERDQDQESAISTSSYEIPPCEELNIASSSVIPDTSLHSEHSSIHDNGLPEIPTSSYSLNPDSTEQCLASSSYENQLVVEQSVSTSYYGQEHQQQDQQQRQQDQDQQQQQQHEVRDSYFESMCKQTREETVPSYYESSENPTSGSYYEPRLDVEASQSYYQAAAAALHNVEATQSFYHEQNPQAGQRLRQQGEATPTYTERYSIDYAPVSSPLDRHDLVESSVSLPAARSMDR